MARRAPRSASGTRVVSERSGHESNVAAALIRRLSARSWEARKDAAAEMGRLLAGKAKSPAALIRKLADSDELVRIEVAESLGAIGDRKALPALRKALNDRSALVRSYVAPAIGELGTSKDAASIERKLQTERSAIAKVGYYAALHQLGRRRILPQLAELLEHPNYRVRCAAANTLGGLASSSDVAITRALRAALRGERTVAARSSLKASLRAIRQQSAG